MGRVMSYKIFSSELSDSFYKRKQHLLKEIAAKQRSGIFFFVNLEYYKLKFFCETDMWTKKSTKYLFLSFILYGFHDL